MDPLSGITAFVRAAETESFAQAARSLGITASGVGKSVARLEAELGVRLMNRTTRRITLTDDGAVFFERCKKILDELADAQSLMSNRRTEPRGRLRVSAPLVIGRRFLVPRLPSFLQRHPELQLEISLNDRRVNLVEESIDVAVRIGPLADSSLMARALGKHQVVTIASPRYLAGANIHSLGQLAQHRCLVFRTPTTGRERPWQFHTAAGAQEFRPRAALTLDCGEALVEAARAGLGVTQIPSLMAEPALDSGDVVEVLREQRARPDPIHAVYTRARSTPLRVKAFLEFLTTVPELNRGKHAPSNARSKRS